MQVSTVHVLRQFTQKMASQNKQANKYLEHIGTALKDPRVLAGAGGALAGGLGGLGLARLTQSEEDKEKGKTPWMMPLATALAGGAVGVYGAPHLAELLKGKPYAQPAPSNYDHEMRQRLFNIPMPKNPNRMLLSDAPRDHRPLPSAPEISYGPNGPEDASVDLPFMHGSVGPDLAAMHNAGQEPMMTTTGHGGQLGNPAMRAAQR